MYKNCSKSAWSTYRSTRELYYIDRVEQVVSILSTGITKKSTLCGEGKTHTIVCFTKRNMALAMAQRLGIAHFALFAIKKNAIPKHCIEWEKSATGQADAILYCFCDHIAKDAVELIDCFETAA